MPQPRDSRGVTLVELMVALLIIGVIAAIAIPDYISRMDRAREASTKGNMHALQLAAEDYAVESGGRYSDVIDATHVANRLPPNYRNPFSNLSGSGVAWEGRALLSDDPSRVPGIASYADSDSVTYNVKGEARNGALPLVLTTGR